MAVVVASPIRIFFSTKLKHVLNYIIIWVEIVLAWPGQPL